ncbi:CRADD [Branchiostoma lanceolatum]|uniref:CRADD protein n=1 Tax=Branchiostoma lanceolatum TaxID=7740 RepID=A0A8J9Z1Q9_BRALA|nr:CRADD [Branchiostoma lanceolatum]
MGGERKVPRAKWNQSHCRQQGHTIKTVTATRPVNTGGLVVSLSARPKSPTRYESGHVILNNLWKTLKVISLEVEDLLKQWPGVRFDRVTVCPECHRPSFPGNWLHPTSRWPEEGDVICSLCDEWISVEYLVPPPTGQFTYDFDEVRRPWNEVPDSRYAYPSTLEQQFADLYVSRSVSNQQLLRLAKMLGSEWESLAIVMRFRRAEVYRFKCDNRDSTLHQIFDMLVAWKEREGRKATKKRLMRALVEAEVDYDAIACLNETERSFGWAADAYDDEDIY